MNLWIRSQNKEELVLVTRIYLQNTNIRAIDFEGYSVNIGIYESRERALDVLDEIQNVILCKTEVKYSGKGFVNELGQAYIYEMPEK